MTSPVELTPTEEQWQLQVAQFARYHGWIVAHFRAARGGGRGKRWHTPVQFDGTGFPDLVLARYGELIFAELKSEKGRTTEAQRNWLDHLEGEGREVYVWRPSDWPEAEKRLGRPAPLPDARAAA